MSARDWWDQASRDIRIAVVCGVIAALGLVLGVGGVLIHRAQIVDHPTSPPEAARPLSPGAQSYSNGQNYGRQLETRGYSSDDAYEACRDRSGDNDISDSVLFAQGCQAGFAGSR